MSHENRPLGGPYITPITLFFGVIACIGFYFIGVRFFQGLGSVSNLNSGFAWGIWIVYDIVIGTAFACGGYALAIMVYVLNKGEYHPLMRPAIVASMLGYALGGFSAFFDMGRYWQFYNIFLPWHMNFNSVMLEVALCVTAYILILIMEFSPVVLERFGSKKLLKLVNKVLFIIIALGILLPTMHQSSLGSLLIAMGHKVHPLWQSYHMQPLFAIITALAMGFSIVVFEGSFTALGFKRKDESPLLGRFSGIIIGLLATFLVLRLVTIIVQGNFMLIFTSGGASLLLLLEAALYLIPIVILLNKGNRNNGRVLLIAAVSMLLAGAIYRFNAFLFTLNPGPGYSYFPSVPEIMITLGIISFEIVAFIVLVRMFPVFHHEKRV